MLRVYPRACGGTSLRYMAVGLSSGLSPRLRGNRFRMAAPANARGSIPALAGEPPAASRICGRWGVYPRACGGTIAPTVSLSLKNGLSPRLRGNLNSGWPPHRDHRSIPALAGEPSASRRGDWYPRVYPRACGGTSTQLASGFSPCGLSPRLRGNPGYLGRRRTSTRSIPALAGEPDYQGQGSHWSPVYPRACGGTSYRHRRPPEK